MSADLRDRGADELRGVIARYALILRRRWSWGLVVLCLVGSISFWCSQYLPRVYQAVTVFERRDDAVLQNLVSQNSPYGFDQLKSRLALDMTGLRARTDAAITIGIIPADAVSSDGALSESETARVKSALARFGLDAAAKIVTSSSGLDVIELRAEARSPDLARRFVVALRDQYIVGTQKRMRDVLDDTRAFFEAELERRRTEVTAATGELNAQFADFPDLHSRDPLTLATRVESLRTERNRLEQEQARLEAQISARRDFLAVLAAEPIVEPEAAPGAPVMSVEETRLDAAIRNIETEISDAIIVKQMTPEHPSVRALRRKIEALECVRGEIIERRLAAASQPTDDKLSVLPRNPLARQVELDVDTLSRQHGIVHADLEKAHDRYTRYSTLARQLSTDSGLIRRLEERVDKANAAAALWGQHLAQLEHVSTAENEHRGTRFSLIEEPLAAGRALSPRLSAVFTVSGGLALACAVLIMALMELFDRSIREIDQVTRATGAPLLECIGVIATPATVRGRRLRGLVWSPALLACVALLFGTATMAYASFDSPVLHQRIGATVDRILTPLGVPPVVPNPVEVSTWEQ